jgi:hypothetical protein
MASRPGSYFVEPENHPATVETEKLRETVFMDIFSVIFYYVGYDVQP